ncbi:MAG: hypothetical protein B7X67_07420, partial [Rhizobiales bacterium 39-66-18]
AGSAAAAGTAAIATCTHQQVIGLYRRGGRPEDQRAGQRHRREQGPKARGAADARPETARFRENARTLRLAPSALPPRTETLHAPNSPPRRQMKTCRPLRQIHVDGRFDYGRSVDNT